VTVALFISKSQRVLTLPVKTFTSIGFGILFSYFHSVSHDSTWTEGCFILIEDSVFVLFQQLVSTKKEKITVINSIIFFLLLNI